MRSTALFFLFLIACLLLAAGLTPAIVQTGWLDFEPHRVMSRLAQVLMILGRKNGCSRSWLVRFAPASR